jgi:hypothetical protein
MASFKEVKGLIEEQKEKRIEKSPAAKILASHSTKDKRVSVRMNSATYDQFADINSKLGASNGSVINMLISEYIMKYKELLG